jgi:hypothetical protein
VGAPPCPGSVPELLLLVELPPVPSPEPDGETAPVCGSAVTSVVPGGQDMQVELLLAPWMPLSVGGVLGPGVVLGLHVGSVDALLPLHSSPGIPV